METMAELNKPARELWQDYDFLTRELVKFVRKKDWELVLELITQRDKLQMSIDASHDDSYTTSPAGRELIAAIYKQNQSIANDLQRVYNNAKRQQEVSNAYDQPGGADYAGSFMDRSS